MGIIQKDAFRTMVISYAGLVLGYVNKVLLFIWFLTSEQIGLVNLITSVGLLFGNLSGLGSSYAIWKFFPFLRNKDKRHYGFLLLILMVSLFGVLLFTGVTVLFHKEIVDIYQEKSALFVDYYYWIIPLGLANILFLVLDGFLRSMFDNALAIFAYELLLRLLITVLLVAYGLDLFSFNTFIVLHCLVYFIPVLILAWHMNRKGELHLSPAALSIPKRFRKIILSFSLFSYMNSIGALIVVTLDALMIAGMVGLAETGVYTMVIYLVSALQIPFKSLSRIALPMVSEYWKERRMAEMSDLYKKFSSVNLVISMTLFLVVWVCREELFHFLPPDFHEGIYVFLFLMIGRLVDMYLGLNGVIFVTSKKYRYDIFFTLVLIVTVTLLNLWLIPLYGIAGSAIATSVAYVIYNVARLVVVYVAYNLHPFEWGQLKVIVLFTAVVCAFEYAPLHFSNEFMAIAVKWVLLGIVFLVPIYVFKLEVEIVRYVNNGFHFIRQKVKRS